MIFPTDTGAPAAAPDDTAPLSIQIPRGLASGLTFGMYKPYAGEGTEGWPETIASMVSGVLPFGLAARGAGLGVAGLSRFAPSLLGRAATLGPGENPAALVTAKEALANMFKTGRQIGPSFSPKGAALALGSGAVADTLIREANDTENQHTIPGTLFNVALSAGLGALGGRSLARHAGQAATDAAIAAEEVGKHRAAVAGALKTGSDTEASLQKAYQRLSRIEEQKLNPNIGPKELEGLLADEVRLKTAVGGWERKLASMGRTPAAAAAAEGPTMGPGWRPMTDEPPVAAASPWTAPGGGPGQRVPYPETLTQPPTASFKPTETIGQVPSRAEMFPQAPVTPGAINPYSGLPMSPFQRTSEAGDIMGRFAGEAPKAAPQSPSMALGRDLVEAPVPMQPPTAFSPPGPALPLGATPGQLRGIESAWSKDPNALKGLMEGQQAPGLVAELGRAASEQHVDLPTFIQNMTDNDVRMYLGAYGYTGQQDPQRAKKLLMETLSRKQLTTGDMGHSWIPDYPGAPQSATTPKPFVTMTSPFAASMKPTAKGPVQFPGVTYEDPSSGRKIFRGPVYHTLAGPGATLLDPSKYEVVNPADLAKKATNALKIRGPMPGAEPEHVDAAIMRIRAGMEHLLPNRERIISKIADDLPFGTFGICEPGSWCTMADIRHYFQTAFKPSATDTIASGFGPATRSYIDFWEKNAKSSLGRSGYVFPLTMVLAGTAAEGLPAQLSATMRKMGLLRNVAREEAAPLYQLPKNIADRVMRVFDEHPQMQWQDFDTIFNREVPEASQVLPLIREIFQNIHNEYVLDGTLRPEQAFVNYLPIVRDKLGAVASGVLHIEGGEGYFPVPVRNVISGYDPQFAKSRLLGPEDAPKLKSLQDRIDLYFTQYARHKAIREDLGEINRLLEQVPENLKGYVGDHMNNWVGKTGEAPSAVSAGLRDLNFARTIGFNVLSPITNTLQRMNTFALVRPTAFAQAFRDARDPARLELVRQAGLGMELLDVGQTAADKLGLDASYSSGLLRKMIDKVGMGTLFQKSETSNRLHAFLAGVREAEARGLTGQETLKLGLKVMDETQFIHSGANAPLAFQSNIGKVLGQFQTYRLNQIHFMGRVLDEAMQGLATGDLKRTLPFIKFWTPAIILGGAAGVLPGDWGEEQATRALFGKAMHVPGLTELLFGVSLGHQMGLGSIGAEDMGSFIYYLPGPSVGYIQGLLGTSLGYSAGRGLDLSSVGQELSTEERLRLLTQSLPMGVQTNRILQALRLVQTNGEYRQALDLSEFMGLAPSNGDLLAGRAADLEHILLQATGLPPAWKEQDRKVVERQQAIEHAKSIAVKKAATLYAAGRSAEAMDVMKQFADTWNGGQPIPLKPESIQEAQKRRLLPPGQRKRISPDISGAPSLEPRTSPFGEE